MKIAANNSIPYLKGIIETFADVRYLPSGHFTPKDIADAEVLIVRSTDKCTRELLEGSPVKLITTATIGYDHIDTDYCESAGITWYNAPGSNASSVSQYILASLIFVSLQKKEPLKGRTIGIIGLGYVGKEVEKVCLAYGLTVLRNDPPQAEIEKSGDFVSLQTIAEEADIITLHTPLTTNGNFPTYHLANTDFFRSLRKSPWFINSARGPVVDTQALIDAKKKELINELIIDCWENEPFINKELIQFTSIATPHIAGFSADGKANATRMCLENIERFYNCKINGIETISPPAPSSPVINLGMYVNNRLEQAVLSSFNPLKIDSALRDSPEKFEWFRDNYNYPREFTAYKIANATKEETIIMSKLGFRPL